MSEIATDDIRNVVVLGGAGSGKTSLVEAILLEAGAIRKQGRAELGECVTSSDAFSKSFGTTADSSVASLDWKQFRLNLIDTPGAPDFFGASIGAIPAAELAIVVIDGSVGVQHATRRLMTACAERAMPTMLVVTKIDTDPDEELLLASIQEEFGECCMPLDLPADHGHGVVDCFDNEAGSSDLGAVKPYHDHLIDTIVEVSEPALEEFLNTGQVAPEHLHDPFEQALRQRSLIPVCFVSARERVGTLQLLHDITRLAPNPREGNPRPFEIEAEGGTAVQFVPDMNAESPLVAHVFKILNDQYAGRLAFVKIHQGRLTHGAPCRVDDHPRPVRIPHVHRIFGTHLKECQSLVAGEIGIVTKVEELRLGSVLHTEDAPPSLRLRPLPLPRAMCSLAIEATAHGAEAKLAEALRKLAIEDPTFQFEHVGATGELVIRGLGSVHLRARLEMLRQRFGVQVHSHTPKVAYCETVAAAADGNHRHKKQSGGAGQFAEVKLRIEPLVGALEGRAAELEFVDETVGGSVPRQFMPAIEKGVRQVLDQGAFAGYPLRGVRVSVYDGKHHPVDSKEIAFITAGKHAFLEAVRKAQPTVLEPYVIVEISVPSSSIGAVVADLSARRARVTATEPLPRGGTMIRAVAAMSELLDYEGALKGITGGTGSFFMEFSHHEPVSPQVQRDLVARYKPQMVEA